MNATELKKLYDALKQLNEMSTYSLEIGIEQSGYRLTFW